MNNEEIIRETPAVIIFKSKNNIVKKLKTRYLEKDWLCFYDEVKKICPYFIDVYKIENNNTIYMKYIDEKFITLSDLIKYKEYEYFIDKNTICEAFKVLSSAFCACLEISKKLPNNMYFMYADFKTNNIIFLLESKKFIIIDPDSFIFVENLNYSEVYLMSQVDLIINLQKALVTKEK
jgi:hypothetical protein